MEKPTLVCPNCKLENPLFAMDCENCDAILRNRVVNIDLWATISKVIESPVEAFRNIIQSEHKNFIIFLSFLIGLKLFTISYFLSFTLNLKAFLSFNIILIQVLTYVAGISALCIFLTLYLNKIKTNVRYKDNFSILTYSFLPLIFSFVILTPLKFAVFGSLLLTFDPSPKLVQPTFYYLFLLLESVLIIWSFLLAATALYVQSGKKLLSVILSLIIYFSIFVLSLITFNLSLSI